MMAEIVYVLIPLSKLIEREAAAYRSRTLSPMRDRISIFD